MKTPGLSIGPRVKAQRGALEVETSILWQGLSLGSYAHRVRFDVRNRFVDVTTRRLWLWSRHRRIAFDDIDYLGYDFSDLATSFSFLGFGGRGGGGFRRNDTVESYHVYLGLPGDERITVGKFRGEGSVINGPMWTLFGGDDLIDYQGTQDDESLQLVDQLCALLDVPLGRPLLSGDNARARICESCRRSAAPGKPTCLYCGGTVVNAKF